MIRVVDSKSRNPLRLLAFLLATTLLVTGCSQLAGKIPGTKFSETLKIVAATELKDMEPLMEKAADDLGFNIELHFNDGTIANSQQLAGGHFDGQYDAAWFATNKYVDLLGAGDKLRASKSMALSPVAFGVQNSKARELGWDKKQPTWAELTEAVKSKKFTYGMTDPSRSNSGFSALVSIATANADTGNALSQQDLDEVHQPLKDFFEGQKLTAGSSGWLEEAFLEDPSRADALINYESVLMRMVHDRKAEITVIVPSDGVVTADYPLSALAKPMNPDAGEKVGKLAEWVQSHQKEVVDQTFRRSVDRSIELPGATKNLIELPFPAQQNVAESLIDSFNNELRVPADTAFVLDVSGSMKGDRINSLKATLTSLVQGTATSSTGPVGFRNREQITLVPFHGEVMASTTGKYQTPPSSPQNDVLRQGIYELEAGGNTAVYDALRDTYDKFDVSSGKIPSIVLMSDGETNKGMRYRDFEKYYRSLPQEKQRIPVFVIVYGESSTDEMGKLAKLTGGKTFDAMNGDLGSAFKEIRGYQ